MDSDEETEANCSQFGLSCQVLKRTVYCSRGRNYVRRRHHLSNKSQYLEGKSVSLNMLGKEQAGEFSKDESKHVKLSRVIKRNHFLCLNWAK